MPEISPYDVMLERLYPPHLHITAEDELAKNEKYKAVFAYFAGDNIDKIIIELAEQTETLFPGKSYTKAIRLFHKNLFKIAESFIKSDSLFMSSVALSLGSLIICNDDGIIKNTELFSQYQELFESKMIEHDRILSLDDEMDGQTFEEDETLYQNASENISRRDECMYDTVSYCLRAASVIPSQLRQANEIHQIAIEMLAYVGSIDIPTYEKIIQNHSDVCFHPEDYPAGEKIVRQSYRALVKDSEDGLKEAEDEGGKESAHMQASNFLWLHAGVIVTFHSISSIKSLAMSAFCQHRDYIEDLGVKKVDVEFTKIRNHFKTYADAPEYVVPVEELMRLMFTPSIPVVWIAPSRPSENGQDPRAKIIKNFKTKWRPDPLSYPC